MKKAIEKPALFSAAMVRALLDGSKGQTRRVVKRSTHPAIHHWTIRPDIGAPGQWEGIPHGASAAVEQQYSTTFPLVRKSPYGGPGGKIWVRETFGYVSPDDEPRPPAECNVEYRADLPEGCTDAPGQWPIEEAKGNPDAPRWKPAIHMPRTACRIVLPITGLRIERLNDISEDDARAEGVQPVDGLIGPGFLNYCHEGPGTGYFAGATAATDSYASLWEKINGAGSWKANPWVWVIEFERVKS